MSVRLETLRMELRGVDPARAESIARLVSAELAALAPRLTADAGGASGIPAIAAPPVTAHAGETDGALAVRIAHEVAGQASREREREAGT